MIEISPDLKEAYAYCAKFGLLSKIVAYGLRDVLADLLEAEFRADHNVIIPRLCPHGGSREERGVGQVLIECNDPRHNWQRSDWQGEADRLLREEAKVNRE